MVSIDAEGTSSVPYSEVRVLLLLLMLGWFLGLWIGAWMSSWLQAVRFRLALAACFEFDFVISRCSLGETFDDAMLICYCHYHQGSVFHPHLLLPSSSCTSPASAALLLLIGM